MASEVKWVKLSVDMFDNRKIRYLRRLPEGDSIVLIWVMLLTMAGRCNAGGLIFLTEDIPYTAKMLGDELGFDSGTVELAMQSLERLNMISFDGDVLRINSWEEHQNVDAMERIREQNRERKRLQRAKGKDVSRDGHVTVTQCHATEEEREEEKEEERERDIHSFIHGQERIKNGWVMISDEQWKDLCDKLSLDELDHYMAVIEENERSGKHYRKKTHYQAILEMAQKDRKVLR